jgi:ankyrin repeat protein
MSMMAGLLPAQTPAHVEFGRDVLPILRQNCLGCHGPSQQISALRLDRRSSVFKVGRRYVVPGAGANSFMYLRLIGPEFGMQMPPSGPLKQEQIETIKTWIEQGAEWPDALANEEDRPPINPQAVAAVELLRSGNLGGFEKAVAADPGLLNARGPEGSTPFMYAALYCGADVLARLLQKGADPNRRNDSGASALMWAASDLNKTRLLLDHGAEVNAHSDELRTPLMIASRQPGGTPIAKLLLERGANPNPNAHPETESSPLMEAATASNAETMALLQSHGAKLKGEAQQALTVAISVRCSKCVELLIANKIDRNAYTGTLPDVAVFADAATVRMLLDHGADVNAYDPLGRTPLMYATGSDLIPTDVVKLLIDRGADVNAHSRHKQSVDTGLSVLDISMIRGKTPVVDLLVKAGAKGTPPVVPDQKRNAQNTVRNALARSLPMIQRADAGFTSKGGCISCHNDSLASMAVGLARQNGFPVDEATAARQVRANVAFIEKNRDRLHQGFLFSSGDFFGPGMLGYILVGLHGEKYKADMNTDTAAMYIRTQQQPDGEWITNRADSRPPLGSDYIGQTALAMRALQLYMPNADRPGYESAIRRAGTWLAKVQSKTNDDRSWRLLGLAWYDRDVDAKYLAIKELLATQRDDGGWSDIASMETNAYATGRALFALRAAGLSASDSAYAKGVRYLLDTQQDDGSWHVKTRSLAFQPYFETGFPYGVDQTISAAGSSWTTMALTMALPSPSAGTKQSK